MNNKLSLREIINEAEASEVSVAEVMLARNAAELEKAPEEILAEMQSMLEVMRESIAFGMEVKRSRSGMTGGTAQQLAAWQAEQPAKSLLGPVAVAAATKALAVAGANAAMGRIVAAPTAGASGVLPGVLFALEEHYSFAPVELQKALVVAGNIGMVIASRASLSGASGGCQAECGSAAAMAAGAAVYLLGGGPAALDSAVAMVLKNMLGLVCDPVAGLVEVPCIKRNAGAALQALLATEMALAGIESFVEADETIDAMGEVGSKMSCSLRETAEGGLAMTPTALAWARKYFEKE